MFSFLSFGLNVYVINDIVEIFYHSNLFIPFVNNGTVRSLYEKKEKNKKKMTLKNAVLAIITIAKTRRDFPNYICNKHIYICIYYTRYSGR